jgi:hypothetical protein
MVADMAATHPISDEMTKGVQLSSGAPPTDALSRVCLERDLFEPAPAEYATSTDRWLELPSSDTLLRIFPLDIKERN